LRPFRVLLTRTAEAAYAWLSKREPRLYLRVRAVLESLRTNPFQGKALKGRLRGVLSYRVGSYRILYKVERSELVVLVLDIGDPREIYRQ
jgi:mRNA interferase RelE/StbE